MRAHARHVCALLALLSFAQTWSFSTQGPLFVHGGGGLSLAQAWSASPHGSILAHGGLGVHRRATASHQVTCSSRGSPPRGFGVPLQLTDRESGITVCLVSTMHYNPTSILRVVGTVDELAKQKRLGAVVIESCPTRYMQWKKTTAVWRRALMTSEMQIAAERAKVAGVEFVLGRRPPRCVCVRARAAARVSVHSLCRSMSRRPTH